MREKLIALLAKYFDIGDSYAYNLTRVKTAFEVGTMSLEDFEEFDEETITDLADFLIENGVVIPVRCEECRKRKTEECGMNLKTAYYYHSWEDDEDYCSYGEPKEREE